MKKLFHRNPPVAFYAACRSAFNRYLAGIGELPELLYFGVRLKEFPVLIKRVAMILKIRKEIALLMRNGNNIIARLFAQPCPVNAKYHTDMTIAHPLIAHHEDVGTGLSFVKMA
jgi:hypothetical protein